MPYADHSGSPSTSPARNHFPGNIQTWGAEYFEQTKDAKAAVRAIHTLGPEGTNLGAASNEWFHRHEILGEVILYRTVEDALRCMPSGRAHAVMTCAVYPELHNFVFANLKTLSFIDCFIWPTHPMLLASKSGGPIATVATHSAPQGLVPDTFERRIVTSNSQAAADCAAGLVDACITTMEAARAHELRIIEDFGPVPMVYTLHARLGSR